MRLSGFPIRLSSRLRVFGVSFLPLVSLLLAIAFSACGVHECFGPNLIPPPALTVANGVVYTQGAGNISALRADAGSVAWRSANGVTLPSSAPAIADGLVIAINGFGALVAHHLSDGSLAWHSQTVSHPLTGNSQSTPSLTVADGSLAWHSPAAPHPLPGNSQSTPSLTVANGIVYAAATFDTIAAWRVADGAFLWQSPSKNPMYDPLYSSTQTPDPVIAGNVVYFFARDAVYAIRIADGSLLWSTTLSSTPGVPSSIRSAPPVIADGRLFTFLSNGSLYALNAATGAVLWRSPDPDLAIEPTLYQDSNYFTRPVVSGAAVYYASRLRIRVLDAATGHLLWQFPKNLCLTLSAPVVAGGVVYVALQPSCTPPIQQYIESGFALTALDAHTGVMRWIVGIQSGVSSAGVTVLVNGGAVYTISAGKRYSQAVGQVVVTASSASTGASLWQRTIQSASADFIQVAYADGVIYLGTEGVLDSPNVCTEVIQPVISALRMSDGAQLWKISTPA
jgi:outer membrane protein assembly factor BamB